MSIEKKPYVLTELNRIDTNLTELGNRVPDIVNDLVTGGADKVLSAEQGKTLKTEIGVVNESINNKIEATNILAGNNVTITTEGNNVTINASGGGGTLPPTNLSSLDFYSNGFVINGVNKFKWVENGLQTEDGTVIPITEHTGGVPTT